METPIYYALLITMQDYMKPEKVTLNNAISVIKVIKGVKWLYEFPLLIGIEGRPVWLPLLTLYIKKTARFEYNAHIPIYSVHDNFITTAPFAKHISDTYINIFAKWREPLSNIYKKKGGVPRNHPISYISYFQLLLE